MLAAIQTILRNPSLRIVTLLLFFNGMCNGATLPYLSIVGIQEFGLSPAGLSLLLALIALANLITGVSVSIFSDNVADRRPLLIAVFGMGIAGFGLIYSVPTVWVFALAAVFLVPVSNSAFSLLFSTVRAVTNRDAAGTAQSVNTVVRATFSGAWMIVPGLMGLWLAGKDSLLGAWGFSALICCLCVVLAITVLPPIRRSETATREPFTRALSLALSRPMLVRVLALSLITATTKLVMVVQPLIITGKAGGSLVDVGLVAGGCATLEIPFMLIWGSLLKRLSVIEALSIGTLIFAGFMAALSFAQAPWQVYLLLIPNAFGLAAILTFPLSYFQDLISDRPGLGTSLYQMTAFVSTALSAAAFALGAPVMGFAGTAWLGVAMAVLGVTSLIAIERYMPRVEVPARA